MLRIRALRLRATTAEGAYGADLAFSDGLVIVRGRNTSGKSTALRAILYALGLEGMLGPTKSVPFPESMSKRLQGVHRELDVIESFVAVEIENQHGHRITCSRPVAGGGAQQADVVHVTSGPALTSGGTFESRGYYVRLPGAASRASGFHVFLPQFIGWHMPPVPRFDGEPGPLYMECVFPFLFVEQLTGWRGVHARMPTFFGIPEAWNRSIEFILRLDRSDVPLRRFLLDRKRIEIQSNWKSALESLRADIRGTGLLPTNIPVEPVATWPPQASPVLLVMTEGGTKAMEVALADARHRVETLVNTEIPLVKDVASQLAADVEKTERRLSQMERRHTQVLIESRAEEEYVRSLDTRLSELEEDLRKNQDELTLRRRGSVGDRSLLSRDCPVCKRPRTDSLLAQDIDITPMPVEANIAHVRAEIGMFSQLKNEQLEVIGAKTQRIEAIRQHISELQALLREQRHSLRADGEIPSSAAIRERMQAEELVARLQAGQARFQEAVIELAGLASAWRDIEHERRTLRDNRASAEDERKRSAIESSFKNQLTQYGFSSFGAESFAGIQMDATTFRPVKDGFDLGEMSASDTIRCIWAYLLSLLEVSRSEPTNHPGLLILDEPRQQSAEGMSFAALIRRASQATAHRQQVIFATSEERPDILREMHDVGGVVIELPQKMLQPID